jgi:hypothetical protein
LYWAFNDTDVVPRLTADGGIRETVLAACDVESVEELAEQELSGYERRNRVDRRLGVVDGDEQTFHAEADLLARVDGISKELAAGLIDECGDIPTICEGQREDGDVYLTNRLHDAEVQDREWTDELRAFCDDLDRGGLERRLKEAGIWVEPEHAVAGA